MLHTNGSKTGFARRRACFLVDRDEIEGRNGVFEDVERGSDV